MSADRAGQPAVGKQTLTAALAPALSEASRAVQRLARGPGASPDAVHAAAAHGTSGAASTLPHLSRIQALFGRHDVSGIRAHVGGRAAEGTARMGAEAFAVGDQVAFAGAPDLHTAAHEAAHVVQQRAGVQLKGGVGVDGDAYEHHADQVADLVVAGRSAESLLDRHAPGPAQLAGAVATPGVQAKWLSYKESRFLRWDQLVNGLRWYIDPDNGKSFFQIEGTPPLNERDLPQLERLEGPSKARTIAAWCETPLFEPSTRQDSTAIEPAPTPLGPATARGVPIPRVGFGTDIELTDQEKARTPEDSPARHQAQKKKEYDTLLNAVGAGYTLFDTAREYGTLDSLGRALKDTQTPPQDVFVIYKIKPAEVIKDFGGDLGKAVVEATASLGRPYLDVLMLHDLNATDPQLEDLIGQMRVLVGKGVVRHLGLSNVATTTQLDLCARHAGRDIGISFVQNKMHPHRQDETMRKACAARGVTYMGYSIMGHGSSAGKCGHVVSSEPIYDVRKDAQLDALARTEGVTGGGPGLAVAWAVQSGTVQIPKTSDPGRMVENRRAGRTPVSEPTMAKIAAMDDVITDDDQAELLEHGDRAINQIKIAIPNKTHWKALDRVYAYGLGGVFDLIAAQIATPAVLTAVTAMIAYIEMIDNGDAKSAQVLSEFKRVYNPGDYSLIRDAFNGRPPIATIKDWWSNASAAGGCIRARTRVLGYIANGMAADADRAFDQSDADKQVTKVAGSQELVVEVSALGSTFPADLRKAAADDECYGKYQGKDISFTLIRLVGTSATIKINATM